MDEIVQSPEYKGMIAASPEILKPCVVGLYGMGGVGKTTISRAIFNEKAFGDFDGKVCYVELGGMNLVELLKTVLQELTEASPEILGDSHDKLASVLKERMRRQKVKVFLILDNVWDHQIQEIQMYLDAGYCPGSMVLVTSRSLDILVQQLHIPALHCLEMPKLTREGAEAAFLHFTGRPKDQPIKNDDERDIIKRCLKECCFLTSEKFMVSNQETKSVDHYLPLALKVLGSQLGSISHEVLRWKKCLMRLEADKFNLLLDKVNPVASVLRLGYDALRSEERYIFLDMALLCRSKWRSVYLERDFCYEQNWMRIMHRKSEDDMKESVNALRRKGLLDRVNEANWMDYDIHDLYAEFAEEEARMGPFEGRRFLIDKNGTDVPHELLKYPSGQCWASLERLIIQDSEVQSLKKAKLHLCKNLEVLVLVGCHKLKEVDVSGMENLRSMEVFGCSELESIEGVEQLSNLVFLCWKGRSLRRYALEHGRDEVKPLFSRADTFDVLLRLASAVKHSHTNNAVHGHLKPENVLLHEFEMLGNGRHFLVKVTDFRDNQINVSQESTTLKPAGRGTRNYAAPEFLKWGKNRMEVKLSDPKKIDVYGFGAIAYEILTGYPVYHEHDVLGLGFREKTEFWRDVIKGKLRPSGSEIWKNLRLEERFPAELIELVEKCLEFRPEDRPSFSEICEKLQKCKSTSVQSEEDRAVEKGAAKKKAADIKKLMAAVSLLAFIYAFSLLKEKRAAVK